MNPPNPKAHQRRHHMLAVMMSVTSPHHLQMQHPQTVQSLQLSARVSHFLIRLTSHLAMRPQLQSCCQSSCGCCCCDDHPQGQLLDSSSHAAANSPTQGTTSQVAAAHGQPTAAAAARRLVGRALSEGCLTHPSSNAGAAPGDR
jgi:hypothetical protein